MARLYFVRHGKAAAAYDENPDPGLSALGHEQAGHAANVLAAAGLLKSVTSPLRRARETAAPFERTTGRPADVLDAVSEIPSPTNDVAARGAWLRRHMAGTWQELIAANGPDYSRWRQGVIEALLALPEDTAIFSHFIAINVAVGAATADDRMVCFHPDNGSITVFENDGASLRLVELGREAETTVG